MKRAGRAITDPQGFTLLEILIAVAILAIGLLAVASMGTIVIKSNAASNRLSIAATLVQDKLEEIRATHYTNVTSTPLAMVTSTPWASRQVVVTPFNEGEPYPPIPGTKKIDVTVSWIDISGIGHSVSLSTLRSEE